MQSIYTVENEAHTTEIVRIYPIIRYVQDGRFGWVAIEELVYLYIYRYIKPPIENSRVEYIFFGSLYRIEHTWLNSHSSYRLKNTIYHPNHAKKKTVRKYRLLFSSLAYCVMAQLFARCVGILCFGGKITRENYTHQSMVCYVCVWNRLMQIISLKYNNSRVV